MNDQERYIDANLRAIMWGVLYTGPPSEFEERKAIHLQKIAKLKEKLEDDSPQRFPCKILDLAQ